MHSPEAAVFRLRFSSAIVVAVPSISWSPASGDGVSVGCRVERSGVNDSRENGALVSIGDMENELCGNGACVDCGCGCCCEC